MINDLHKPLRELFEGRDFFGAKLALRFKSHINVRNYCVLCVNFILSLTLALMAGYVQLERERGSTKGGRC